MATKRNKPQLAEQIRRAVAAGPKTRYQIAKESGVSEAALCRFAAGKGLKVESLEAVAAALGLEIIVRRKKGG